MNLNEAINEIMRQLMGRFRKMSIENELRRGHIINQSCEPLSEGVKVTEKVGEKFEGKKVDLSERQKKIIKFIRKNNRITTSSCASLLSISADTALRELTKMKSLGLIKTKGIGRGIYYVIR